MAPLSQQQAPQSALLPQAVVELGWAGVGGLVALLVVSFVISQCLVVLTQRMRLRRVLEKSQQLIGCTTRPGADADGEGEGGVGEGKRIPVTLITGFLGAGKTTLLNHILSSPDHGYRVAVVVNEFGAVSVDHALISGRMQDGALAEVVVMKNGCMCCSGESPGSELEGILNKLLVMAEVDPSLYDYMLIETSGLADPTAIVHLLFRHEMARSRFVLDGVVTLVDATNVHRHLPVEGRPFARARARPEVARQVALADVVVLSKFDLVDGGGGGGGEPSGEPGGEPSGERALVERAIRTEAPAAEIVACHPARAPLHRLLGIGAFRARAVHVAAAAAAAEQRHQTLGAQTVCLRVHGELRLEALQRWLQHVVTAYEPELFRLKGTLRIEGRGAPFVVQGVHGEVRGHFDEAHGAGAGAEEEEEDSVLVLIAATGPAPRFEHRLDEDVLQRGLQACADDGDQKGGARVEVVPSSAVKIARTASTASSAAAAAALKDDTCVECGEDADEPNGARAAHANGGAGAEPARGAGVRPRPHASRQPQPAD